MEKQRSDSETVLVLTSDCCIEKCLRQLSFNDIQACEVKFASKTKNEQRNWILGFLSDHTKEGETNKTEFQVKGQKVCKMAWLQAHNIKKDRYRRIMQDFKDGLKEYKHRNEGQKKPGVKTSSSIAWMQFFVNALGDQQPDNNRVHLPSCFKRITIFNKMKREIEDECVSQAQFYRIWTNHFPHVNIPKVQIKLF